VGQGLLNLLLNSSRNIGLEVVAQDVRHGPTGLFTNRRNDQFSKLVVNQGFQNLLGIVIEDIRHHIKQLKLMLVEILVTHANTIINLIVEVAEGRLERLSQRGANTRLETTQDNIERLGRNPVGSNSLRSFLCCGRCLLRRSVGSDVSVVCSALLLAWLALGLLWVVLLRGVDRRLDILNLGFGLERGIGSFGAGRLVT
jgi:hypothetical protein